MSGARVAFDSRAPFVVACESLVCGSVRLARGNPFPWRELGMSEIDLLTLWIALQIDVSPDDALDLAALTAAQLADLEAATAPAPPAKRARR